MLNEVCSPLGTLVVGDKRCDLENRNADTFSLFLVGYIK